MAVANAAGQWISAPDCLATATATAMRNAKGFEPGTSIDMTTSEICRAQSGRNSGATCHTETFVSRALCQVAL